MRTLTLREATPCDAQSIREIYAPYIEHTAVTYEYDVPSVEDFRGRIVATLEHFPYLVAEADGVVCGYAYAGKLHERKAFERSTEISIYVAQDFRGQGIGARLYTALEASLCGRGFTSVYACIASTHRNPDAYLTDASIRFHEKMGFHHAGRLWNCAYKFGAWYDMVYMEKHIAAFPSGTQDGEVLDVLDARRMPTGKTVVRGKNAEGLLHTVVHVCVLNAEGQMLVQQRAGGRPSWPGLWDVTLGGHVCAGESPEQAAARELYEELGLSLAVPERASLTVPFDHGFDDYFILHADLELGSLRLQESEVQAAAWKDEESVIRMIRCGTFIPYKEPLVSLLFSLGSRDGAFSA